MKNVFLGGTCGNNNWREQIVIPGLLERGVDLSQIFNPVVPHWDEEAQKREDQAKSSEQYLLLFVLASPDPETPEVREVSGYSLIEAIQALHKSPERAFVLFDTTGQARKTAKGMMKGCQDLKADFPGRVFDDYSSVLDALAEQLRG